MRDPQKRILELERRNEALENALEAIRFKARETGVTAAILKHTISRAVMDVRNSTGQEV